jgi:hypothetical protein
MRIFKSKSFWVLLLIAAIAGVLVGLLMPSM